MQSLKEKETNEKLKTLIKEEKTARKVLEKEENIIIEKVTDEMRELIKQTEKQEEVVLQEIKEQLIREGKPLSREEEAALTTSLKDMQSKRLHEMKFFTKDNDSMLDSALRTIESGTLNAAQKVTNILNMVTGTGSADRGLIKEISDSLERRQRALYPAGQLHDHTTQRKMIAGSMLLLVGGAAIAKIGLSSAAAATKEFLYNTACEAQWMVESQNFCTVHTTNIISQVGIKATRAAQVAAQRKMVGMGCCRSCWTGERSV